jgi:hypothetical protein
MQHLGFGPIWRDIISGLLSSASTSMLFILAIDVLRFLISKAESVGLLKPLPTRTLQHRVSFYADDVVLFLHPAAGDINITLDILQVFGEASGLRNNVKNSSVYPIRCDDIELSCGAAVAPL